jgi:tetratricopeptide (TPR) repeat protein
MWDVLVGDAERYDEWARAIASGDWVGSGVFYQTPLYPYLLGLVFSAVGHSLLAVRLLQAGAAALACVLVAVAGRNFVNARVGVVAGALLALYPEAIFFDGLLQKSSLDLLLMSALLCAASVFQRTRRTVWLAIAGVVVGLLILNRENALLLPPVLALWIWFSFDPASPRQRARWIALTAFATIVVLAPVALRNYAVGGEFIVSTSQFGPNFYIGNRTGASGAYEPLIPGRGNAKHEAADARALAEQALGRPLSAGEVSNYWFKRTAAEILAEPGSWLRLMGRKLLLTINAAEMVDSESRLEYAQYSFVLQMTSALTFGVLLALAVLGAAVNASRWRELAVVHLTGGVLLLSVAGFFVFSRYRYPVVPALALLAGAGIATLARRPFRLPIRPAVAALVVGIVAHLPLIERTNETHFNIALQLSKAGRHAEAIPFLARAVEIRPDDAESRVRLGLERLESGDAPRALVELREAARRHGTNAEARAGLGRTLEAVGSLPEAIQEWEAAVRLDPRNGSHRTNFGIALWKAGRRTEAIEQYRAADSLQPDNPVTKNNLAAALQQMGQAVAAIPLYRAAIALRADYGEAHSNLALALAETGQLTDAVTHFEAALRSQPRSAGMRANYADLLLRLGKPAEAVAQLEQSLVAAAPGGETMVVLLERLGEAYSAAGRGADGRDALVRALDLARASGLRQAEERLRALLSRPR